METNVTRELVPEAQRSEHVGQLFGVHFPMQLEPAIYDITSSMATEYNKDPPPKTPFWSNPGAASWFQTRPRAIARERCLIEAPGMPGGPTMGLGELWREVKGLDPLVRGIGGVRAPRQLAGANALYCLYSTMMRKRAAVEDSVASELVPPSENTNNEQAPAPRRHLPAMCNVPGRPRP